MHQKLALHRFLDEAVMYSMFCVLHRGNPSFRCMRSERWMWLATCAGSSIRCPPHPAHPCTGTDPLASALWPRNEGSPLVTFRVHSIASWHGFLFKQQWNKHTKQTNERGIPKMFCAINMALIFVSIKRWSWNVTFTSTVVTQCSVESCRVHLAIP